jgi:RimJ/RimL family protein N-acetyltransferase
VTTPGVTNLGEQPVGDLVEFTGARRPEHPLTLRGRRVLLRPLDPATDAEPLFEVSRDPSLWTYMYDGPYDDLDSFRADLERQAASSDPLFFAVVAGERPLGVVSYLVIVPEHGTIELGNIWFAPSLQRTAAATEAIYLLIRNAFDELGYRRVEWKCNALNAPSRRAAERFGFEFEGVFAQHRIVKGRNRDTAWFSITDARWPAIRSAFEGWLDPSNFNASGDQLRSLGSFRSA